MNSLQTQPVRALRVATASPLSATSRAAGVEITFFRWMALMVPILLVMAAVLFVLLYLLHPERRPAGAR